MSCWNWLNGKVRDVVGGNLEVEFVSWSEVFKVPAEAEIVVNATSIGLYPDVDARLNLNMETLDAAMVVADVIPNPPNTCLVKESRERGCRVIDGLEMLVAQGVIGIEYWNRAHT